MPTINIEVKNKIARQTNKEVYVCGNSDFVIAFVFDAEWNEYAIKTARFKYNGKYQDIVFTGNECPVPVIQNTGAIDIGVYAGDLHTTTAAVVMAKPSILSGGGVHDEPPKDVYDQIMEALSSGTLKGEKGEDGVSPTVSVADIAGGHLITITDKDGTQEISVMDGKDGGDGKDGIDGVSVEHSWDGTVLNIKSASGESSADLKGDKGYTPQKNIDYFDGKDGVSAEHSWDGTVLNIKSASGESSADLKGEKGDAGFYPVVTLNTATAEIQPNIYYRFGEVTTLNITLAAAADDAFTNEYIFEFISGATATTLTLPDTIKWVAEPIIMANKTYQVSIMNGIGVIGGA